MIFGIIYVYAVYVLVKSQVNLLFVTMTIKFFMKNL